MNAPNNNVIKDPTSNTPAPPSGGGAAGENTEMSDYLQKNVFTASNFLYFIWFLGIYLIIFLLLSPDKNMMGRIINIFIIVLLLFLGSYMYFTMSADEKTNFMQTMVDWTKIYFEDTNNFYWEVVTIVVFYILVFVLNIPMTHEEKPFMIKLIEDKLWIIFFTFIIIFFFKYLLGINIVDLFFDYFDKGMDALFGGEQKPVSNPPLNTKDVSNNVPAQPQKEEVFNIMNNLYTYDDAKAICKSYGARLATYEDLEQAYNNGAEWCSYGWSEDQMAYFPTQKKTWQELQKNPKTKNNCGRPGINGGYMANPNLKFGVNCFGVKPKPKQSDLELMNAHKLSVVPKTAEEMEMEKKVKFWKEHQDQLLLLNSFNNDKWSKY